MQFWKKKSQQEIQEIVFKALDANVNYKQSNILGIPASYLDEKVFNTDVSFLKDAPFISTLVQNPNHIGCHTLGTSESFFKGTQEIEKELIEICAVDILKGEPYMQDGYVASGGTEANMQAIWIYRNYYMQQFNAKANEIAIISSSDSHYSMDKAGNVFLIDNYKVLVDENSRAIREDDIHETITTALQDGKKYFIVVCNMMTTMFGSVDSVDRYANVLSELNVPFKIHVDGAFGGFYYPFSDENSQMTFENTNISSFTLDAHKMAQAPYGTGIFLIRKGMMQYANTQEASYVEGEDSTLIGSRSGANAIAVWMILMKNGPFGWFEKIFILQKRTEWLTNELNKMGIQYFRHPHSNIVTMRSKHISNEVAKEFGLVPDNHHNPKWYKVVVMDHVTVDKLNLLVNKIKEGTAELTR